MNVLKVASLPCVRIHRPASQGHWMTQASQMCPGALWESNQLRYFVLAVQASTLTMKPYLNTSQRSQLREFTYQNKRAHCHKKSVSPLCAKCSIPNRHIPIPNIILFPDLRTAVTAMHGTAWATKARPHPVTVIHDSRLSCSDSVLKWHAVCLSLSPCRRKQCDQFKQQLCNWSRQLTRVCNSARCPTCERERRRPPKSSSIIDKYTMSATVFTPCPSLLAG